MQTMATPPTAIPAMAPVERPLSLAGSTTGGSVIGGWVVVEVEVEVVVSEVLVRDVELVELVDEVMLRMNLEYHQLFVVVVFPIFSEKQFVTCKSSVP